MPQIYGPPAKTARRFLTAALLLPLLGACDAIYDDTKGWANRLEASILQAAHEIGEPQPDGEAEMSVPETPPAVPVAPVDTAALPASDGMAPEGMAAGGMAPPAMGQDAAAPALSAPGMSVPPPAGAAAAVPEGLMANAADNLLAAKPSEAPQQATASAAPPLPKAKPAPPAPVAQGKTDTDEHGKDVHEKPTVADAKVAETTPAAPDAAVAVVLHLSSLRSEDAAKREWGDLQKSFPEPLAGMAAEFRRTSLGDQGTYYRVLAGPLPSRSAAQQVCASLKAKDAKQYCRIMPAKPAS
ncbi:MAG: SPOR domain-containing protein [Kiloniellaceae bacterium]